MPAVRIDYVEFAVAGTARSKAALRRAARRSCSTARTLRRQGGALPLRLPPPIG